MLALQGQMELLMKHFHLFKEVKIYHRNHGVSLVIASAQNAWEFSV